jgi:hypothetical protein
MEGGGTAELQDGVGALEGGGDARCHCCAAVMREDAASKETVLLNGAAVVGSGNAAPA